MSEGTTRTLLRAKFDVLVERTELPRHVTRMTVAYGDERIRSG